MENRTPHSADTPRRVAALMFNLGLPTREVFGVLGSSIGFLGATRVAVSAHRTGYQPPMPAETIRRPNPQRRAA
jgi:hypothetical protein